MKKTIYVLKTLWREFKEYALDRWDIWGPIVFMLGILSLPFLPAKVLLLVMAVIFSLIALAIILLIAAGVICFCFWIKDKIKHILRVYDEQEGGK